MTCAAASRAVTSSRYGRQCATASSRRRDWGANVGARLLGHTRYERARKLVKRQVEFQRHGGVESDDLHSLLRPRITGVRDIDELDEGL